MKPWRIYTRSIDLNSRNDGYDRQKTLRRRWFEVLGLLHLGGGQMSRTPSHKTLGDVKLFAGALPLS